jgi:hypothetical protein
MVAASASLAQNFNSKNPRSTQPTTVKQLNNGLCKRAQVWWQKDGSLQAQDRDSWKL